MQYHVTQEEISMKETREQLNKNYVEFPVLECFENQTKENYISKT